MKIRHVRRTAIVIVAALITLTGCTGSSVPATTVTSSPPTQPTQPVQNPVISLETVKRFDLGQHEAWPLVLTPTTVLAPVTTDGGAMATQIWQLDLATGEQSVVAQAQFPDAAIVSVATTGGWVAWVEERRIRSGSEWHLAWTIQAKDLVSGEQLELAAGNPAALVTPPASAPHLISGDGLIGWSDTTADGVVEQLLWQPGQAAPQVVPLTVPGFDGASSIADGRLVGLVRSDDYAGQVLGLGNCWSYPLDGSGVGIQLTYSGLVQRCSMVDNHLVWAEHIDLQASRAQLAKAGDLPYLLISQTQRGISVTRILNQGTMRREGPVAGTDFAWWSWGGSPVITSLTTATELVVKNADKDFSLIASANGDQLAYQLRRADGSTVIAVVKVVEAPAPVEEPTVTPSSTPTS